MKATITQITLTVLFVFVLFGQSFAQDSKQTQAREKAREAIKLMDSGKYDESISLLKEAIKLDPKDINYPYEIAYAQYAKGDYKAAVKTLEGLEKREDVIDFVFQLLGNSYDLLGNEAKAISTYEKGLKLFPNSGKLYLEMGVMQLKKEDYNTALTYFEKGVLVDPMFPSNYYWSSRLFLGSEEEIWGMLYGELFINLERNTRRTAEISKLLYDTYKSEITFPTDSTASVSFSKNMSFSLDYLLDTANFKLPFSMIFYETSLLMAIINEKEIDLPALNRIRTRQLDAYFSGGHNEKYPNVLYDYLKQMQAAGHLEAYNYWLLLKGDELAFGAWQSANEEKWQQFVEWFVDNPIQITPENSFHRTKY